MGNVIQATNQLSSAGYLTSSTTTAPNLSDYLTFSQANQRYYTKPESDLLYLTSTQASSTYLTPSQASSTYLTPSQASSTYLSRTDPLLGRLPNINVGQIIHSTGPSQLTSLGVRQDGFYWYLTPTMTQPINLFTRFNWVDGKAWVRVFSSPAGSAPTINMIGMNIPWDGFLIQQSNGSNQAYSYINTTAGTPLFNIRSDTTLTTGGNKPGFRVYIGQAGGHGFYNTTQGVCSWSSSAGAVGSGWISDGGACGTFPSNIRWGTGQTSTAYALSSAGTVWETWITW